MLSFSPNLSGGVTSRILIAIGSTTGSLIFCHVLFEQSVVNHLAWLVSISSRNRGFRFWIIERGSILYETSLPFSLCGRRLFVIIFVVVRFSNSSIYIFSHCMYCELVCGFQRKKFLVETKGLKKYTPEIIHLDPFQFNVNSHIHTTSI